MQGLQCLFLCSIYTWDVEIAWLIILIYIFGCRQMKGTWMRRSFKVV
jgi:hypothetical protein